VVLSAGLEVLFFFAAWTAVLFAAVRSIVGLAATDSAPHGGFPSSCLGSGAAAPSGRQLTRTSRVRPPQAVALLQIHQGDN